MGGAGYFRDNLMNVLLPVNRRNKCQFFTGNANYEKTYLTPGSLESRIDKRNWCNFARSGILRANLGCRNGEATLRDVVQSLELYRHRLDFRNRIDRVVGNRRHGNGRSRAAHQDVHELRRPRSSNFSPRNFPKWPTDEALSCCRQGGVDRRHLWPTNGDHGRRRIEHPPNGRRPRDDSQDLGLRDGYFSRRGGVSHPQVPQLAAGADYRYTSLAQVDTWGRAGVPVLEYNVDPLERRRRFRDPLRAEKLALPRRARCEETHGITRIQEAANPGRAVDVRVGGIRLGRSRAPRLSLCVRRL